MYQILQNVWYTLTWWWPSIAMMYHLRRVSDLLCNWKSCLLCYMKDVVLHCSIFFKWNKLVRVRVRVDDSEIRHYFVHVVFIVDYSKSMFADHIKLFKLADIAALFASAVFEAAHDLVSCNIEFWIMLVFIDGCKQVRLPWLRHHLIYQIFSVIETISPLDFFHIKGMFMQRIHSFI